MAVNVRQFKYLLGWLIAGSKGGPMRAKMVEILKDTPQNANQLAILLEVDYKTIRHHIEILEKNNLITSAGGAGSGYGTTYFLSPALEENYALFEDIRKRMWQK
ncbi:MAG: winged helix-turn-helix domain-containing protein [Candidatus Bathyarchaeia archaeon]|jgi:predicted ArsR family transcriptional regulator